MYADFLTQPAAPMFSTDLGLQPGALKTLLSLMASTSDTILSHYNKTEKVSVERKADKSPVTAADKAAHEQLSQGLAQLSPDIPVLSEESPEADIAARRQWPACWVVDPLDGTKEFIGRTGEFTINVALVRDSRPVLGGHCCAYGGSLLSGPTYGGLMALPRSGLSSADAT